jgi:hypothetical protein
MDAFEKQERMSFSQRFQSLARSIPVPGKSDAEWQVVENELFLRLENQTAPRNAGRSPARNLAPALLRPLFATLVVLMIAIGGLFTFQSSLRNTAVTPLSGSRVLRSGGAVMSAPPKVLKPRRPPRSSC